MRSERFNFPNAKGEQLAATLDVPLGKPTAYALFAHCFTCGKDNLAAKRIAERLAGNGIAVLRFDFTGLGGSEGEFANTHFSSNVDDLVAAADHLRKMYGAPAILIGHSLGGCAVLAASHRIAEARAVVTIAAPYDPAHVVGLFKQHVDKIKEQGEVECAIGRAAVHDQARIPRRRGREEARRVPRHACARRCWCSIRRPTTLVGIDNASHIFGAAKHPKSFVSLAGADHLLSKKDDAVYVANVIAAWAERYLDKPEIMTEAQVEEGLVLVRETHGGKFQQEILTGPHRLLADEPVKLGGLDCGPGPYDFLLAGLGACTSMTIRLYADFKKIPLDERLGAAQPREKDPQQGLRGLRGQGHQGRSHRARHHAGRPARRRAAQEADGDRRQVPGAPDAGVEGRHPHGGAGGVTFLDGRMGVTTAPPCKPQPPH